MQVVRAVLFGPKKSAIAVSNLWDVLHALDILVAEQMTFCGLVKSSIRGSAFRRFQNVKRRRFGMEIESLEERIVFAVPDFGLVDVNLTSPTYTSEVSPRDFVGKASGWYFGHST